MCFQLHRLQWIICLSTYFTFFIFCHTGLLWENQTDFWPWQPPPRRCTTNYWKWWFTCHLGIKTIIFPALISGSCSCNPLSVVIQANWNHKLVLEKGSACSNIIHNHLKRKQTAWKLMYFSTVCMSDNVWDSGTAHMKEPSSSSNVLVYRQYPGDDHVFLSFDGTPPQQPSVTTLEHGLLMLSLTHTHAHAVSSRWPNWVYINTCILH